MRGRGGASGWLLTKLRRHPAIGACGFAVTVGITLGNVLVPSLDQALGIDEVTMDTPVLATSASPSSGGEQQTSTPSQPSGGETTPGDKQPNTDPSAHDDEPDAAPPNSAGPTSPDDEPGTADSTTDPAEPSSPADKTTAPGEEPDGSSTSSPGTGIIPIQPPLLPRPTTSPSETPDPTEQSDPEDEQEEACVELDLSPIELALCLIGGSSSTQSPTPYQAPAPPSTTPPSTISPSTTPLG